MLTFSAALFALVLCILAGLVSGSLALYTTTAEFDGVGSVIAKNFVLTAEGTQGFGDNLFIAPEDKVEAVFTVSNFDGTNVTEVPMELDIEIVIEDAAEDIAAIPNIVAKLIDTTNSTEYPIPLTDGKGSLDLSVPNAFSVSEVGQTLTYKLVLHWESNDDDIEYQGHDYGNKYSITVTGTQIPEYLVNGETVEP